VIVGGTGLYIDMIYRNFWLPNVPPDYEYRSTLETAESQSPGHCHTLLAQLDPAEATRHHPSSTRFIIRALEMIHRYAHSSCCDYEEILTLATISSTPESTRWSSTDS
jgi:tRNA A37 N6-isopentenylltransferase MiaA